MAKAKNQLTNKDGSILDKAFIANKLATDDKWLYRGVVAIYERQTADEQSAEVTAHDNGIGFNSVDAMILSSFAKQIMNRGFLTISQLAWARKKMAKYAGQLLTIVKENRSATVQA